jgi:hypothetical protein
MAQEIIIALIVPVGLLLAVVISYLSDKRK